MNYISLFSGIEAATQAWHPLGFKPVCFSENDAFPSAVLAHHYPNVPNVGDVTQHDWRKHRGAVDIVVGGSPCQAFSVAGMRKGFDDPRGNLTLAYLGAVDAIRPRWVVWENVPGVLSHDKGRTFGTFLGALGELGYGFAYRILDAQFCRTFRFVGAVAQRRRRVFVVGYLGDWRPPAAVLFDSESLRGNPAPRRQAGEEITGAVTPRSGGGGNLGNAFDLDGGLRPVAFSSKDSGADASEEVSPTLRAMNHDASHMNGGGQVAVCVNARQDPASCGDGAGPLDTDGCTYAVAIHENQRAEVRVSDVMTALTIGGGKPGQGYPAVLDDLMVRRLTPMECERLQGFPDNFTLVPYRHGKLAANSPRYKAIGNSMAVNCMEWIGHRLKAVDQITQTYA